MRTYRSTSSPVFDVIVTRYWPNVVTDGGLKLARSMIACICTTATRKSTTTSATA
jgi:hypothetical protein